LAWLLIDAARPCRHTPGDRWFVDETYVKVSGRWVYLYRAIDQFGQVIDVLVTEKRDLTGFHPSPTSHAVVGFRFSGRLTQGPAVRAPTAATRYA
jgi:DDE domain